MESVQRAIQQVSNETDVDARFILAVMIQESWGCVRAPTTNGGVRNPGLMQDHNGSATCNSDIAPYAVQVPCPRDTITQMIREGSKYYPLSVRFNPIESSNHGSVSCRDPVW